VIMIIITFNFMTRKKNKAKSKEFRFQLYFNNITYSYIKD